MKKFIEIKTKIKNFKNYLLTLSPEARKIASPCYLIKKEEIEQLLSQNGNDNGLDGIRIYIGSEMIDNKLIPSIHALACYKNEAAQYDDYNVPANENDLKNDEMPMIVEGMPCPKFCSNKNILNS